MAAILRAAMFLCRRSLKYGRATAKSIENHPTITKGITVSVLLLGGYTVINREGPKRSNKRIAKKIQAGSNPMESLQPLEYSVDRSDVVKSIQKLFESDPDNGRIGVIVGPTGSGKTRAVIEACSIAPGPNYILYQEIYETSEAGKQLARAADIPLSRNTFDNLYRSLGFDSQFFFPSDPVEALSYVMSKVAKRSMEVIAKDNLKRLPCFVIDATELLAVHEPDILNALLRLAQYYVRAKKLRIVLVDSDGITLSKINENLQHPIVDIVEVDDLKDHDAKRYLIERTKMSDDLVERLVNLIGGRLLYLGFAVNVYQRLESDTIEDDIIYQRIKECFFIKVIAPINEIIINTATISKDIMECFCLNDSKPLFPSELKNHVLCNGNVDSAKVQKLTDTLVNTSLLRYNADGKLMWHSRLIEREMKAQFCSKKK